MEFIRKNGTANLAEADLNTTNIYLQDLVELFSAHMIPQFNNLNELLMRSCKLKSFDYNMSMTLITELYLYDNELTSITGVASCSHLKVLGIMNNKLEASCLLCLEGLVELRVLWCFNNPMQ